MSEFVPRGLMWIRMHPDEKPVWIGGETHEPVPPSIAHLFANTVSDDKPRERVGQYSIERARRDLQDSIDRMMQSSRDLPPPPETMVEPTIVH